MGGASLSVLACPWDEVRGYGASRLDACASERAAYVNCIRLSPLGKGVVRRTVRRRRRRDWFCSLARVRPL